ncbi:hypothetical protein K470DRAFT_84336 [Piedraia hortae CBS 480.64]|uniref:Uncharacterized protein n=1 Tax=Piedraia hortae CBS 480.64 TaxID=1314780 RepID=A0A6A7C9E9_9PEZI|nr:hypothetical protein K470DRAFT_84336 [Piedraia hortae CBS 480.64]
MSCSNGRWGRRSCLPHQQLPHGHKKAASRSFPFSSSSSPNQIKCTPRLHKTSKFESHTPLNHSTTQLKSKCLAAETTTAPARIALALLATAPAMYVSYSSLENDD